MTLPDLLAALADRVLLCDGAMGTELQRAGLEPGGCGEAWNVDAPERVLAIQRAYVEAGADCLTTNTFGASAIMLERHGEATRTRAINEAGVELARRAFGARRGFVLGDIGPFGGVLEPWGDVPRAAVEEAFGEQAEVLVEAGVDAVLVETQTSLEELGIGLSAARSAGAPCVVGSLAFDALETGGYATMMGVTPEAAASFLVEHGADVLALNCGTNLDARGAAEIVARYRAIAPEAPILAQPNNGSPELIELRVVYRQTPAEMADGVASLLAAGACWIGGCCGTTPDHVRALRAALEGR